MTSRLAAAAAHLAEAGVEDSAREARWLADRAGGPDAVEFEALITRRAAREPLAYVLGDAPFRQLTLAVSPTTLIPRADSETLIEAALAIRPDRGWVRRVLDLGTGTGCLLLAALTEYPHSWGLGVDRVPGACCLAAGNAAANYLAARASIICADWGAAIDASFDLILSNPPYIRTADLAGLMPEVALYEPSSALDGGADGYDSYRSLLRAIPPLLAPDGVAILELGAAQAAHVTAMAVETGWQVATRQDRAGHDRALILSRAGAKKSFGALGGHR